MSYVPWVVLVFIALAWVGSAFYYSRKVKEVADPREKLPSVLPAGITLFRIAETANIARRYRVLLDGRDVGAIAVGESLHIPTPSPHTEMQVQVDWCKSRPLRVNLVDGASELVECGCAYQDITCLLAIFFRPHQYLYLERSALNVGKA